MPMPAISKQHVLAALTAATHARHDQGRGDLAGLSMDELAAQAGVSRATLYRLFGSQQHLLQQLGHQPPPTVRSRILDTALDLVGRHGLAELSMDELAGQAGVSRATLYRLFPGKEALFAELVRTFSPFEPIAAILETMGERPPAEVIPEVAHAMAAAMDGHIGLLLQLLFEFARHPAAGRLRRMDPDVAMQALVGPIVMHLLMQASAASHSGAGHGVALPLEGVVDELVGIWLRAMTPGDGHHQQPASKLREQA